MLAVLPVKALDRAKQRLAKVLSLEERRELVLAMLADVVETVRDAGFEPVVLSRDHRVRALGIDLGARAAAEPAESRSLNRALAWVLRDTAGGEAEVLIVLPDTPLLTAQELRRFAAVRPDGSDGRPAPSFAVVAPDDAKRGTNALLLSPPLVMAPRFGRNSLNQHLSAAGTLDVPAASHYEPGLAFDLDTADDLQVFLGAGGESRTARYLVRIRAADRLTRRND